MALIESEDPVVLVVYIVGDVLQVLEMGAERGRGGKSAEATVVPGPLCSHPITGGPTPHRMSRSLRRRNSQCAMFSTARHGPGIALYSQSTQLLHVMVPSGTRYCHALLSLFPLPPSWFIHSLINSFIDSLIHSFVYLWGLVPTTSCLTSEPILYYR